MAQQEHGETLKGAMGALLKRQRGAQARSGAPDLATRRDRLDRLIALSVENAQAIAEATRADYAGARSLHMTYLTELFSKVGGVEHARDCLEQWMQPERRVTNPPFNAFGAWCEVVQQPLGVVGIISPWNLPFGLSIAPLTSAIAGGNRAMIKPSEYTPRTSDIMAELFGRYFAPEEVTIVLGGPEVGEIFASLPFDHLLFTGSTRVGRAIMRAAAENLTPVTLELGGKCPVVVGAGADIARTASTLAYGKMVNAGQLCLAPDYVLAPRASAGALAAAITAEARTMYPDPAHNLDLTGIINASHHARLSAHLADAHAKGATISTAGEVPAGSLRMPLQVIEHATPDMTVMEEEIFGPLLPIVAYNTLEEALAFIAARPKPLGLYAFTDDSAEERVILAGTESGGVTVNDILQHYVQEDLPFGGVGASGMGAYHGHAGFLTFSHSRAVFHQGDQTMASMFRPPFGPELLAFLQNEFDRRRTVPAPVT